MSSVNETPTSHHPSVLPPDRSVSVPAEALITVPVRNTSLLPGVVMPITVGQSPRQRTGRARVSLCSPPSDRTFQSDTAMIGEISPRGLVLPVGGIKEKVVAATAGLTRVMFRARIRRDFYESPRGVATSWSSFGSSESMTRLQRL
jgi:hypothetical protein